MEAVALAQRDARLKLLRYAEAMSVSKDNLVADYMAQNRLIDSAVRSLILSARPLATRYRDDGTVEVDMGVNLDDVFEAVRETKM